MNNPWIRVTRKHPCPICGRPDWCGYLPGTDKVVCMRVESDRPTKNGGFLHNTGNAPGCPRIEKPCVPRVAAGVDLNKQLYISRSNATPEFLYATSRTLGVSVQALNQLEAGRIGENLSFPMRDGLRNLVGFRLRTPAGKKLTVKGTHTGLFIPLHHPHEIPTLLICEGPTDCAALVDLGFAAIGRPSCSGGGEMIKNFLKGSRRDIVIVADNDEPKIIAGRTVYPGQDGAVRLARAIADRCRSVRIILPKRKDIRDWYRHGATPAAVKALIQNAAYFRST